MRKVCAAMVVIAVTGLSSAASAQDPTAGGTQLGPGVLKLGTIEIVGRVQKPLASFVVDKIAPKLALSELRQPFLDRIEEAIHHDPF
jgi:hypothetical protein